MSIILRILITLVIFLPSYSSAYTFIDKRDKLKHVIRKRKIVMIASPGRSGSTMLTYQIEKFVSKKKYVLKTHLLPPENLFKGKIVFIFSNPDQASESALHMTLFKKRFGFRHFNHVETADRAWAKKIGSPQKQTKQDNLLSKDVLGVYQHLKVWLFDKTIPANPQEAQILAIKFENLWDAATIQAIRNFLHIPNFKLPVKKDRGAPKEDIMKKEIVFRKIYNLGTNEQPRYAAYDCARELWEAAPPFQFLKIK